MRVSIERGEHTQTYKTWFGLGAPRTDKHPFVRVTIHFSEEEKEIIKRAPLDDYMIYEHPADELMYREREEIDQTRRSKLSVAGAIFDEMTMPANPRYRHSRFVHHFLEQPIHEISPFGEGEVALIHIETTVEKNVRELKNIIEGISSRHPTGKRDIDL